MKRAALVIFLFQLILTAHGQSEIGANVGINESSLYGNYEYFVSKPTYTHAINYATSIFYKEPITDRMFAGFELENMHVRSSVDLTVHVSVAFGRTFNALLDLNYLNLHFLYGVRLFSIKKTSVSLSISPYFGYLLHSKAVGYYTGLAYYSYVDSLGQKHEGLGDKNFELNETQTKFMRKANIGISLKLDVHIPVNDRLSMLIKPSYNFGIYDVLNEDGYTGIRGYTLTAGFAYRFDKKFLHFSEWKNYAKPTAPSNH